MIVILTAYRSDNVISIIQKAWYKLNGKFLFLTLYCGEHYLLPFETILDISKF